MQAMKYNTRQCTNKGVGDGQEWHIYTQTAGVVLLHKLLFKEEAQVNGHSLVVSFAQKEQQPPSLHCGQDEGRYPDKSDEAAGGLGSPLLHDEALLHHSDVFILPHTPREQQAFPPEILRVFRQRHHGDKTENES